MGQPHMAGDGGLPGADPQTQGGLAVDRFLPLANDLQIDRTKTQGFEQCGHRSIGGQEDAKEGRRLDRISVDEKLFRSDPFREWSAGRRDHGRIIREPSKACQERPATCKMLNDT